MATFERRGAIPSSTSSRTCSAATSTTTWAGASGEAEPAAPRKHRRGPRDVEGLQMTHCVPTDRAFVER